MNSDANPYASPKAADEGAPDPELAVDGFVLGPGQFWAPRGIQFPSRCVVCNEPTDDRRLLHPLSWGPSWVYWLLLLGVLPCFVAIAITTKRTSYRVGVCDACRKMRMIKVIVSVSLLLLALTGLFASVIIGSVWLGIVSAIVGTVAGVFCLRGFPLLRAAHITPKGAVVEGACPEFVRSVREVA